MAQTAEEILNSDEYFRCGRLTSTMRKAYCVELQDRLVEAVMAKGPNAKFATDEEIGLSLCKNCPQGWRNRKEMKAMSEKTKKCTKCEQPKPLEEFDRNKSAQTDTQTSAGNAEGRIRKTCGPGQN